MLFTATSDIVLGTLQSLSVEFLVGETAYQSRTRSVVDSSASGEVLAHIGNIITLVNVKGVFKSGLNIIGSASLTEYAYTIKSDDTFDDTSKNKIADNINVRKEANKILDFDETNPFLDTNYN